MQQLVRISIHAPRTGSDLIGLKVRCQREIFQSTLPARGATHYRGVDETTTEDFNPRSPHGERPLPQMPMGSSIPFQSTLPARGATEWVIIGAETGNHFNPRSPHGERHAHCRNLHSFASISIHAPRTGSDGHLIKSPSTIILFQSTLPARGATLTSCPPTEAPKPFQSTLPARGATASMTVSARIYFLFQSTLPARGATSFRKPPPCSKRFQSTLPARGATAQSNNSVDQNHRLCTKSIPQNSPFEN